MVKITDPNNESKKRVSSIDNDVELNSTDVKLTYGLIKEMLKPGSKKSTTPINFRLDTNIVNELKLYAEETDTTITEVFKDILIEYYNNKKITKGTFNLKKPVNLIIPKSRSLLSEYIENNINVVSTVKETVKGTDINPLDPHISLYETSTGGYELVRVTRANNILDVFDNENKCYRFMLEDDFLGNPVNPEDVIEDKYTYSFHRGLLLVDVPGLTSENESETLIIDTLVSDSELISAYIISVDRAIELARNTHNTDLISFIRGISEHTFISNLVSYDNSNRELTKENYELKEVISKLIDDNETLKLEVETLNNEFKENFTEVNDNDYLKYVETLEKENKELKAKVNELKLKEAKINKSISEMEVVLTEYMDVMK